MTDDRETRIQEEEEERERERKRKKENQVSFLLENQKKATLEPRKETAFSTLNLL